MNVFLNEIHRFLITINGRSPFPSPTTAKVNGKLAQSVAVHLLLCTTWRHSRKWRQNNTFMWSSSKMSRTFVRFLSDLNLVFRFYRKFRSSNLIKIRPIKAKFFHTNTKSREEDEGHFSGKEKKIRRSLKNGTHFTPTRLFRVCYGLWDN
jgi:hypothetical protein